jgi:hypothetical protein
VAANGAAGTAQHKPFDLSKQHLNGIKPANIPFEQSIEFIINLKAVKQIGVTIPRMSKSRGNAPVCIYKKTSAARRSSNLLSASSARPRITSTSALFGLKTSSSCRPQEGRCKD